MKRWSPHPRDALVSLFQGSAGVPVLPELAGGGVSGAPCRSEEVRGEGLSKSEAELTGTERVMKAV